MTQFVIGQPQTTEVPRIAVDAGLKPGLHRFRLVVVDDRGLASAPDEQVVQIQLDAPIDPLQPLVRPPVRPPIRPPVRPPVEPPVPLRPLGPRKPRTPR